MTPKAGLATAARAQEPIAPYSAQRVVERVQTLADGTRITQPSQTMNEYRDSEGRTRTEQLSTSDTEAPVIKSIDIIDPVAGFRYTLDPVARTVRRKSLPKLAATAAQPAAAPVAPKPEAQISRDSLGTETIDGILIRGTRTTTVYPADLSAMIVRLQWSEKTGYLPNFLFG